MKTTQTTIAQATQTTIPASSIAQATQATEQTTEQGHALKFVLINRPGAGRDLFAHTAAAFAALGLFEGQYATRADMLRVWGPTALKYHAERFHIEDGAYTLNDAGFSKFGEWREVDPDRTAMFFELLTTGQTTAECPMAYRAVKPL